MTNINHIIRNRIETRLIEVLYLTSYDNLDRFLRRRLIDSKLVIRLGNHPIEFVGGWYF